MIQKLIATSLSALFLVAFSPVSAQKAKNTGPNPTKQEAKFLDDIEFSIENPKDEMLIKKDGSKFASFSTPFLNLNKQAFNTNILIENVNGLQLKYSVLLDTEVESVKNIALFEVIDDWYGTRYVYGGSSKKGIDCSAFVQAVFETNYHIDLPRTAREQHKVATMISRTELKQGDLVFFNTIGGVSHVGIYLQNNKFVHAASSGGVMISDLYDDYWMKRFVGAGRIEKEESEPSITQP